MEFVMQVLKIKDDKKNDRRALTLRQIVDCVDLTCCVLMMTSRKNSNWVSYCSNIGNYKVKIMKGHCKAAMEEKLRELLVNMDDTYSDFVEAILRDVRDDEGKQEKLLQFLEKNPDVQTDDVIDYVDVELLGIDGNSEEE